MSTPGAIRAAAKLIREFRGHNDTPTPTEISYVAEIIDQETGGDELFIPLPSGPDPEGLYKMFRMRLDRIARLASLHAPDVILANEIFLVAASVLSISKGKHFCGAEAKKWLQEINPILFDDLKRDPGFPS